MAKLVQDSTDLTYCLCRITPQRKLRSEVGSSETKALCTKAISVNYAPIGPLQTLESKERSSCCPMLVHLISHWMMP